MRAPIWIICSVVWFASTTAHIANAQTIDGGAYFSPITDNVQPLIHGNLFSKSYLAKRGSGRKATAPRPSQGSEPRGGSARAVAADEASLNLRFDPAVSRQVRDQYLDAIERSSGSKAADGLRNYYASNDARGLLGKALQPYNLRTDDLGDITTAYVAVMWMTANQAPLPTVTQVRALREQVRATLLDEGKLPVNAEDRQRAAEALIYQTVTLIRVREVAQQQNNAPYLAQLADSAQTSMQRQAFDLRGLIFTQDGMQPRR